MTNNPQPSNQQPNTQQKDQPDVRAQNSDTSRQSGQQTTPGMNPQNKMDPTQPKTSENKEDENKSGSNDANKDGNMKSGDQYKKSAAGKY